MCWQGNAAQPELLPFPSFGSSHAHDCVSSVSGKLPIAFKTLSGQEGQQGFVLQNVFSPIRSDSLKHQAVQLGCRPVVRRAGLCGLMVLSFVLG